MFPKNNMKLLKNISCNKISVYFSQYMITNSSKNVRN